MKDLSFAKGFTDINDIDVRVIMYARKMVQFSKDLTWVKQSDLEGSFDVVTEAYANTDVCGIIRLYILNIFE